MENQIIKGIPIVTYVNKISKWWPADLIVKDLGLPGYAPNNDYNVFIFGFWLTTGPADIALLFSQVAKYFGLQSSFGKSDEEIRKRVLDIFHANGKIVLVSAFGGTQTPTTSGADPIETAINLAKFVKDNNFDGVDLDWEDSDALEKGTGEKWLIDCTNELRSRLPKGEFIITHAPQAPYFTGVDKYKNGGYLKVHQQVGKHIDWYNIQYYNQCEMTYDSYQLIFEKSGGGYSNTSVGELIQSQIPPEQIVIGKPVSKTDVCNTGLISSIDLGQWAQEYQDQTGLKLGLMTWQYSSDLNGQFARDYVNAIQ